jgi:hypothetical protein
MSAPEYPFDQPSLLGPLLKLQRAHFHLKMLAQHFEAFHGRVPKPYYLTVERETDVEEEFTPHMEQWAVFFHVREPPPLWFSPIIGDFFHAIRSALNYLAYELVVLNGNQPGDRIQFPIFPSHSEFKGKKGQQQVAGICDRHVALLERFQPYHGRHPLRHPLDKVRRMSNQDRHGLLVVGFGHISDFELVTTRGERRLVTATSPGFSPLKDGARISSIGFERGRGVEVKMERDPTLDIVFRDGLGVLEVLREIGAHVHWIINQFAVDFGVKPPVRSV